MTRNVPIGLKILTIPLIGACIFACGRLGRMAAVEGIHLLRPSIDTEYAPQFSEKYYSGFLLGKDIVEIEAKMGPPMSIDSFPSGTKVWNYSRDGKAAPHDFAWRSVGVILDHNGKVRGATTNWHYE